MKVWIGDEVKYICEESIGTIYDKVKKGDTGIVILVLDKIALSIPPKNYYRVKFNGDHIVDLVEDRIELVSRKIEDKNLEELSKMTKTQSTDTFDVIATNWKKIVDYLESCIDIALENCETQSAIKHMILLEEACKAWVAEDYSFEGKFDVR